jgi:hypothetical protein
MANVGLRVRLLWTAGTILLAILLTIPMRLAAQGAPVPTVISEIHNAPGWTPSTQYTYSPTEPYTRVLNGPGWAPGTSSYNPGQTLNAYQLTSTGICTSASGGGPAGTGSSIQDGTCTWKYLSPVDYTSITGWAYDAPAWKSGTSYGDMVYVTSDTPLRTYASANTTPCVSIVAPTGTSTGTISTPTANDFPNKAFQTSDGCLWVYMATINYTSKRSFIPTQTLTGTGSPITENLEANYEAQIWNDREYVAGENGENSPITVQSHNDYMGEGATINGCGGSPTTATNSCLHIIITTAPGESFADTMSPASPLTGFDPTNGVAIYDNNPPQLWEPAGILVRDNDVDLIGLQIESLYGAAVNATNSYGNAMTIQDCILEGGSTQQFTSMTAVNTDTSAAIVNSLIVATGPIGVAFKYPGFLLHDTVVHPNGTGNIGVEIGNTWVFNPTLVSDTAFFGFSHVAGHLTSDQTGTSWSSASSNNVTDTPRGDSGTAPWAYGSPTDTSVTVDTLPGTIYGASASAAFVSSTNDWRVALGGTLHGTGGAIGPFDLYCSTSNPSCPNLAIYNFDTPDIIRTVRPGSDGYDVGAWQTK